MGQSELLAGALAGGFILYLAMNNRLATYWALLTGGAPPSSTASTSTPPATTATAAGTAGAAVAQAAQSLVPQLAPAMSPFDFLSAAGSPFGGF